MLPHRPRAALALLAGPLGVAACTPPTPRGPDAVRMLPSRFDAEVDAVVPFAASLSNDCSDGIELSRTGQSSVVILTDPATHESTWQLRGCKNEMHFELDCSDSRGHAWRCSSHQWPNARTRERPDPTTLALVTALRDARALDESSACQTLTVRPVPGARSTTATFALERCGKRAFVEIACGGSPLACTSRRIPSPAASGGSIWEPPFERHVTLSAARPAWTSWGLLGASGLHHDAQTSVHPLAGVGVELTVDFLQYDRFPLRVEPGFLDIAEMRAGPWATAATSDATAAIDGGLTFRITNVYRPAWGNLGLRAGVGYVAVDHARASRATLGISYGLETVRAHPAIVEEPIARVVASLCPLLSARGTELLLALEISPTLFAR